MITKEAKAQAMKTGATHKTDVGSPQVQAAVLTARIKEITEHLKVNKHDQARPHGSSWPDSDGWQAQEAPQIS